MMSKTWCINYCMKCHRLWFFCPPYGMTMSTHGVCHESTKCAYGVSVKELVRWDGRFQHNELSILQ